MTSASLSLDFRSDYRQDLLPTADQPEWVQRLRHKAWAAYQQLPEPLPLQRNLRRMPVLNERQFGVSVVPSAEGLQHRIQRWGSASGWGQLLNANQAEIELSESLQAQGVIFCSLAEALVRYPEKVQPFLDQILPAATHREVALNLAYWRNGFFLWIPRQLQVEQPLILLQGCSIGSQLLFSRSLVVLEPGAQATLVYETWSETRETVSLSSDVLEISLAAGAGLKLIQAQNWGQEIHTRTFTQARLGRDASFSQLHLSLGAAVHLAETRALLQEAGAEALFLGLNLGQAQQYFRQETFQEHQAPHTRSELLYHTVLRDEAYSFFNGRIYVTPQAQQSNSTQVSKSLLLSAKARADAIPNLEILADDVQSGHGAAIGSLDAEQRFYLMSRGFDQATAEAMLVEGFMEEVLLRFPHPELQQRVSEHLSLHLLAEREERGDAEC